MKRSDLFLGVILPVIFIGSAKAQPLAIGVSDMQSTMYLSATAPSNGVFTTVSRTMLSSVGFSDSLSFHGDNNYGGVSQAVSDLAQVGAYSGVYGGNGLASADSQVYFSPLSDQIQTINLQFSSAARFYYCSGSVSLFDLTSNVELWSFHWDSANGNVPWVPTTTDVGSASAELDQQTEFFASHRYELAMMTSARSASDHDQCQIHVGGFHPVPEPSSACLLLMGLLGLPAVRRLASR